MRRNLRRAFGPAALLLCGLLGAAPAGAKDLLFDDIYTIDVPQGWTFTQEEPGYMVFVSPDQKSVFLITTGLSMPQHREKTAALVRQYDNLRLGAPDRFASLMKVRYKRVAVTIIGDHPDRVRMFRSIKALAGDKMRDEWLAN